MTPDRLHAKDAGDIYRLFGAIAPDEMATIVRALLDDTRSAATTAKALDYLDQLYLTPGRRRRAGRSEPVNLAALVSGILKTLRC